MESLSDTSDDTFDRWFPPFVKLNRPQDKAQPARGYVRSVFGQVFRPDANNPAPQPRVLTMISRNDDSLNGCTANTKAYTNPSTGRFHICDHAFTSQSTSAKDLKCDDLGTQVSKRMNSLTGTLIHEFMHWDRVGKDVLHSAGKCLAAELGLCIFSLDSR